MSHSRFHPAGLVVAVVITLLSWVLASGAPAWRLWGISYWGFAPQLQWSAVAAVLLVTLIALVWAARPRPAEHESPRESWPGWPWVAVVCASLVAFLYWLLRARTFFLGDGYLLLSELASADPLVRLRNFGGMVLPKAVKSILPGTDKEAALAAYRLVSLGAGVAHSVLVLALAPKIFNSRSRAMLFSMSMMTGGFCLLQFGYVENYAVFGLCVAAFTYLGLLAAWGRLRLRWLFGVAVAAVCFHALGLCLWPGVLFLWLRRSGAWSWYVNRPIVVRAALFILAATPLWAAAGAIYASSPFIRFAIVPWAGSRFSVEGYSMCSWPHVADLLNLLLLLVPSLWVLVSLQWNHSRDRNKSDIPMQFLAVTSGCALVCTFVFEAKLGMPRDWDLFSFAGIPLLAMLLYSLLRRQELERHVLAGVMIALVMNGAGLLARAYLLHKPELGIEQFRQYADLDLLKNRTGWQALAVYYEGQGDWEAQAAVRELRLKRYPEDQDLHRAIGLFRQGAYEESLDLTRGVLSRNPIHSEGWLNLGRLLTATGFPDSAIAVLETVNGLNPDAPPVLGELGLAYFFAGNVEQAERNLLAAHRADTSVFELIMALARLYQQKGDEQKYELWLSNAAYRPGAEGQWATELGDLYLKHHDAKQAARAYSHALEKGADSAKIFETLASNPDLVAYMRR